METRLLTHQRDAGWSSPLPADLDSAQTLVAVFAATAYGDRPAFWTSLRAAFPQAHVLACSRAGEIAGDRITDDGASILVARFRRASLWSAAIPIQAIEMSRRAGAKLGQQLAATAPRLVLVLAEGLHVNGTDLVQGLAEGIHFGQKAGLDIEAVLEVISKGAAGSWQMENRGKTMNQGKFDFGFAVDWMRKDLSIVLGEARKNGASLPVTALVDQFYADVQKMGGRRWDTSSLIARLDK